MLEETALELVAEKGPQGCTLAEVSRRAGVSVAAPYKHFADREALLAALVLKGYQQQRELYLKALKNKADPVDQLVAFAQTYVRFATEQRALFELTFAAGLDKSRYPELSQAGADLLEIMLEPARKLRPTATEARNLVLAIAASAHGFAVFVLEGVLPAAQARKQAGASAEALI